MLHGELTPAPSQRDLAGAGDGQALRSALASLPPRAKKDFLGKTPSKAHRRSFPADDVVDGHTMNYYSVVLLEKEES